MTKIEIAPIAGPTGNAAKVARIVAAHTVGADTRLLELEASQAFAFAGGQFVIVDSGLVLPSGKAAKRAYSILSADAEPRRWHLAVKRIPDGPCSGHLHGIDIGDEVRFTGPWGKLRPPDGATGPVLILATDTGVSAALGLVQSRAMAPLLGDTAFVWLRPSPDYFLPEGMVRACVPAACRDVQIDLLPPIGHPERIPRVRALLGDRLARGPLAHAFIAGDGAVNYALLDDLVVAGIPATRDNLESFFNMPKKSA